MNPRLFVLFPAVAALAVLAPPRDPVQVADTSYVTSTGERVLRIETFVPVSRERVWDAFTTEEGARRWVAPVVSLDFHVGGSLAAHHDPNARIGSPGTVRSPILNYLEGELITFKVDLHEAFPEAVRSSDEHLQEIVQLVPQGRGGTKIVSSVVGWGRGPEWDRAYAFMARGNAWTYRQLARRLTTR